jgi:Zn-dependent M28 family amino/carboxypeptidase
MEPNFPIYIVISSHYDSGDYLSPYYPGGPGADDNASGTAGVIECAQENMNILGILNAGIYFAWLTTEKGVMAKKEVRH